MTQPTDDQHRATDTQDLQDHILASACELNRPEPRLSASARPCDGSFARSEGETDVNNSNPHREFGLVSPEVAGRLSGVEFLQSLLDATYPAPPFSEVAEVWPISVEVGRVVFEASPSARFYNPMGSVHGGWLALLLDTAMACAVHSTLEPGQIHTTVEMKAVFVRPVRDTTGKLRCEGVLLHAGSRIASSEGKVFDRAGRLVAHGSETCLISTIRSGTA